MTVSFLLCVAGLAAFAVTLPRHRRQIGLEPSNARHPAAMRTGGVALIACSLLLALERPQPSIAAVEWFGVVSVAAGCVVATLILRAGLLPAIGSLSVVAAIIVVVAH